MGNDLTNSIKAVTGSGFSFDLLVLYFRRRTGVMSFSIIPGVYCASFLQLPTWWLKNFIAWVLLSVASDSPCGYTTITIRVHHFSKFIDQISLMPRSLIIDNISVSSLLECLSWYDIRVVEDSTSVEIVFQWVYELRDKVLIRLCTCI